MNREAQQVLDLIIKPTLKILGMDSPSANLLMVYTGAVESGYNNLRQVLQSGNYGPAVGWWEMEEATYNDMVRYLSFEPQIKKRILAACYLDILPPFETMIWNHRFALCMARIKYWEIREPLPRPDDLEGLAKYWKKYYNTPKGSGTVERFIEVCKNLVICN